MPKPSETAALVAQVRDLYERGLSTRKIASLLGLGRRRVDRALREAGVTVAPRGAGRKRPAARHVDPEDLPTQLRTLYADERLTRRQISEKLGISEGLVRARLAEYGITTRSRGRFNREDRQELDDSFLTTHYRDHGLTAEATGELLGVTRRIVLRAAHDHGLPVRPGAPTAELVGPIELLKALYADPLVSATLARHHVPRVAPGGPIWQRFPEPIPITGALCAELYVDCGVSTTHIELLTGQPGTAIRRLLISVGTTMRGPGGRCPFLHRWEQHQTGAVRTARRPLDRRR